VSVVVHDPYGVTGDAALPRSALALDPRHAERELGRLEHFRESTVVLRAIHVTRHKPGKRCVVEYDIEVATRDGARERVTLVGKMRAARYGNAGHRLLAAFWDAGFDAASVDGISVPEPIGTVGAFTMWLQRKVAGVAATAVIASAGGAALATRIAEAAHKIHRASVPATARHTMADELRILRECFARVSRDRPSLAPRLAGVLDACERLAASTPRCAPAGIHRDFYGDQVIVDGARLHIVDFDLYCEGEPALDVGNFIGHLTEQSLRMVGHPDALADREAALEERFLALAGPSARPAVRAYAMLTVARHVYLSTTFPERRPFTEALLELCEERLGVGRALAGSR